MAGEELFEGLAAQMAPQNNATARGAPRLRAPERDQIELRAVDIDSLIGQDHPVRVIWGYVEGLDLSVLEDRIRAREHTPGHPPISPRLLLALWLYATSEGVGSARALERLCESHDVYRWLCGGVSVNYHTLADFRVGCADLLDRLLASMWRRWPRRAWSISTPWRRTGCGCAPARARPRFAARRRWIGIWRRPRRWSRSSSARWTPMRMPVTSASGPPRSGRRANAPSGSKRRRARSPRSSSSAKSAPKSTTTAKPRRSRAPPPRTPMRG